MDALANGRKFRIFVNRKTILHTGMSGDFHVALIDPSGSRVVEMLERVARERGYPDVLTNNVGLNYEASGLRA